MYQLLVAEFFGKVRFRGPFYVNDGAILLTAVELDLMQLMQKGGSRQVRPEACKQCESVRKRIHTSFSALSSTHLEWHPALAKVLHRVIKTFRLLPMPFGPVNWVVLMSTLVP